MSTTKTSAASKAKSTVTVAKKTVAQKAGASDKATSSTVASKAKPEVGQVFISKRVWPD